MFVKHAHAVLADVERAIAEMRGAHGPEAGTVRVGCGPMSGTTDIPGLAAAVRARHPGITLEPVELWDNDLAAALIAGEIDIALGWGLAIGGELARRVVRREPYVVVVADGHRLPAGMRWL